MSIEIDKLLYDLCVDLGFCLSPADQNRISNQREWNAEGFARSVIEAEGMNPEYEKHWCRKISQKFRDRFNSEIYTEESSSQAISDGHQVLYDFVLLAALRH